MSRKQLVIDCDAGTDDAQAIMMALAYSDIADVIAVTSVFGNATLEDTTRNILRVLTVCGRTDIPVYKGCASTLLGNPPIGDGYHGYDGLGDIPECYAANTEAVKDDSAVNALIRLAKEHSGKLTLVALGPLTNIAVALKLNPDFGKNLKDIFIMGGTTSAHGNMSACAEFNFLSDPEAALCVLSHVTAPVTLLPLEMCERFSFSWDWYRHYSNTDTQKGRFLKDIERHMVAGAKKANAPKYWCWDQLAVAVALNSAIVTASEKVCMTVELCGTHTRGQCVIDWRHLWGKPDNVRIVTDIDHGAYEAMLYAAIGRQSD